MCARSHQLEELVELEHAVVVDVHLGDEILQRRLRRLDREQRLENRAELRDVDAIAVIGVVRAEHLLEVRIVHLLRVLIEQRDGGTVPHGGVTIEAADGRRCCRFLAGLKGKSTLRYVSGRYSSFVH